MYSLNDIRRVSAGTKAPENISRFSQSGYLLGKLPEEIRISDVVEAMDGSYELDEEVSELPTAQVIQRCIINSVNEQTNQLLQGLTLKELVEKTEEITAYSAEMYYI